MRSCKGLPESLFRLCWYVRFSKVFPEGYLQQKWRAGEVRGFCNVFSGKNLAAIRLFGLVVADRGGGGGWRNGHLKCILRNGQKGWRSEDPPRLRED